MQEQIVVDRELIRKYGGRGPRYTSYPTADRFIEAFDAATYGRCLRNRSIGGLRKPLTLYVHLPFCESICYYCACNKIVTRQHERAVPYIRRLKEEMRLVARGLEGDRQVSAMHWGGGTPTFLGTQGMAEVMSAVRSEFSLAPQGEYSIEIDPRRVTADAYGALVEMGFNRASFGVQDFDIDVQQAVNRVQSFEQTLTAMQTARRAGFRSLNLDLIFGLPRQSTEKFSQTLDKVLACDPDRIALYGYAHLPEAFKPQRRILAADLPAPEVKMELLLAAIARLQGAGYVYIGMDHFAKPADDLAVALRQGQLQRDFQGYSSGRDSDTIGLGLSAISSVGPAYAQNHKDLDDYYSAVDGGMLPVMRGIELTSDDLLRRALIRALACQFVVSKEAFSIAYLVDFDSYFEEESADLAALEKDGLIETDKDWIHVTPRGRLLVRSVCMVFDRYLRSDRRRMSYSRVM
jgi:oxygen-independent coproporphyrinogen-3 oxidase